MSPISLASVILTRCFDRNWLVVDVLNCCKGNSGFLLLGLKVLILCSDDEKNPVLPE